MFCVVGAGETVTSQRGAYLHGTCTPDSFYHCLFHCAAGTTGYPTYVEKRQISSSPVIDCPLVLSRRQWGTDHLLNIFKLFYVPGECPLILKMHFSCLLKYMFKNAFFKKLRSRLFYYSLKLTYREIMFLAVPQTNVKYT